MLNHLNYADRKLPFRTQELLRRIHDGLPYIIYEPAEVYGDTDAKFLMGHEVAHFILQHVGILGNAVTKELEADELAGSYLFKLGVSLKNAINVKSEDTEANHPHSSGKDRRAAIKKGWLNAQRASSGTPYKFKVFSHQSLRRSRAKNWWPRL